MFNKQQNITNKVVRRVKHKLNNLYPDYIGEKHECPVCNAKLAYFLPLPSFYLKQLNDNECIHSIFDAETLNLDAYLCPACQCSDRDRLYTLYLREFFAHKTQALRLIDFAPAAQLQRIIKQLPNIEYRSADLFMTDVDDRVDITNMEVYADESFDVFICSHVLEHIEDDKQAMRELFRILRPGGWGIAMVPISLSLKESYENAAAQSEADRWKHFGQNDHVRMYSKQGFINNLAEAGFKVKQLGVSHFGRDAFERCGIHPRSVLYIATK